MILPAGTSGWFRLHDLLRLYATECAAREDEERIRGEAIQRLFDYYLETATAAGNQLLPESMKSSSLLQFTNRQEALEWLDGERASLAGAVRLAIETGRHADAGDLAFVLSPYFDLRKQWDEWALTQQAALTATRELGDRAGESKALHSLGNLARQRRDLDSAARHYGQALKIRRELGDRNGEALTLNTLAMVYQQLGKSRWATKYARKALRIQREIGHRHGEALTLNTIGSIHRRTGTLSTALEYDRKSLLLHQELGDHRGAAQAWNNLGSDHRLAGRAADAIRACEQALELHREVGDRYGEAQTLFNLGLAILAAGDDQARLRECWKASGLAFAECGDDREADNVRLQLAAVTGSPAVPAGNPSDPRPTFYYHSQPGQQGNA